MIDFDSGVPLNRQITADLRERIRAGEWPPGAGLPREVDLAHEYGVGVDTVRDALIPLFSDGTLVRGHRGVRHSLPRPMDLEPVWPRRGSLVSARMPTPAERRELKIPEGVPVMVVRYRQESPQIYRGDRYILHFE